jgi:hypothetical protein
LRPGRRNDYQGGNKRRTAEEMVHGFDLPMGQAAQVLAQYGALSRAALLETVESTSSFRNSCCEAADPRAIHTSEHPPSRIAILRELVDHIEIGPPAMAGSPASVTAHGLLPRVLAYATKRQQRAVNGLPRELTVKLVAGEGFEPPTLGL